MLTDEGRKRMDEALLASVMRKLLTDPGAYVDVWVTPNPDLRSSVQIDGDVAVTVEEAAACYRAREEGRRARG